MDKDNSVNGSMGNDSGPQSEPEVSVDQLQPSQEQDMGEVSDLMDAPQVEKNKQNKIIFSLIASIVVVLVFVMVIVAILLGNNNGNNNNINNDNKETEQSLQTPDNTKNIESQRSQDNTNQDENTANDGEIADSYFVSNDTKYVFTLSGEELGVEDDEVMSELVRIHMVYLHSGDKITGARYYYEFVNAEAARKVDNAIKASGESDIADYTVSGKYIIMEQPASEYEDYTFSDIKAMTEMMRDYGNVDESEL